MSIQDMSPQALRSAADLKEQIEDLNRQLAEVWNGNVKVQIVGPSNGHTRRLSYAGRKAIADAQKRRWKKFHAKAKR